MMRAVVLRGDYDVEVEERPKPVIKEQTDVIVKVTTSGLCGTDLHMYRGHQKTTGGHIMGHEFIGIVESVGNKVTKFKAGDKVVSVFATICQECWFCRNGLESRCETTTAFGSPALDGVQADFVRVPHADGTLHHAPAHLDDGLLLMMSDIFPTGYYGAMRAVGYLERPILPPVGIGSAGFGAQSLDQAAFVILGCGPVGLCALLTAKSKGVKTVYAVDSVDERLEQARSFGGIPLKLGVDDIPQIIKDATEGRGADGVVEVVGNNAALKSAFDLVRKCGVLSSIGFHTGDLPFTAFEAYAKNLTVNFGRAAISAVFDEALACLEENKEKVATIVSHTLPLGEARHGYEIFEKHQAQKVVFQS